MVMIALHGRITAKEYHAVQPKHPAVQKLFPCGIPVSRDGSTALYGGTIDSKGISFAVEMTSEALKFLKFLHNDQNSIL